MKPSWLDELWRFASTRDDLFKDLPGQFSVVQDFAKKTPHYTWREDGLAEPTWWTHEDD